MGAPSRAATVKYHYFHRFFTYSMVRRRALPVARRPGRRLGFWRWKAASAAFRRRPRRRSASKTVSGGEFGWGGTSVKD